MISLWGTSQSSTNWCKVANDNKQATKYKKCLCLSLSDPRKRMRLLPSGAVSLACLVLGTGSQGGVSLPRSFGSFSFLRTEARCLFPMPFEAWLTSLPPPISLASGTSWVCMSVHSPNRAWLRTRAQAIQRRSAVGTSRDACVPGPVALAPRTAYSALQPHGEPWGSQRVDQRSLG